MFWSTWRWLPLLVLLSCDGDASELVTYYKDVKPILDGRCVACHQEGEIAPFPMDTYAGASVMADAIVGVTAARTMPPWGAVSGNREYLDDPSLTDAQLQRLADWAAADAPEGDPSEEGDPIPPIGTTLERVDAVLSMPEPYTPNSDLPDDYRCFVLDWEGDTTQYVTGFNILPGNKRVVHHVAAFLVAPGGLLGDSVFETIAGWDAGEAGPGYTCYGGPSSSTGDAVQIPIQQLAQWVPGMGAIQFAEGTGIRVPPGSQIILQLHYNIPPEGPGADQTQIEMMVESDVAVEAQFAPYLDASWPIGNMEIRAGAKETLDIQSDPRAFFNLLSGGLLDLDDGFDIHSVLLHMHTLGQRVELVLKRANGDDEVLIEVDPYDFDWQLIYRFAEPVRFVDGDALYLACTFDNTAGSQDVNWGEGTEEEMCVANLYISELP